jgi:hypothetical protein
MNQRVGVGGRVAVEASLEQVGCGGGVARGRVAEEGLRRRGCGGGVVESGAMARTHSSKSIARRPVGPRVD